MTLLPQLAAATLARLKQTAARRLRAIAARLDPPTRPYGEWDEQRGLLVIKTPAGKGAIQLATVQVGAGAAAVAGHHGGWASRDALFADLVDDMRRTLDLPEEP